VCLASVFGACQTLLCSPGFSARGRRRRLHAGAIDRGTVIRDTL
jgi:hypothetical protein